MAIAASARYPAGFSTDDLDESERRALPHLQGRRGLNTAAGSASERRARRRRRPPIASHGSRKVVVVATIGNLAITVTKFVAAAITGSSAMASEGVHSLLDTGNELLLLYGMKRSGRPADATHPLGHGRELYFWSFIVALTIFVLGAGLTILEGVSHILNPEPMKNAWIAYGVLGVSAVFEGISWAVALRAFRAGKGDRGIVQALRDSKDPGTFTVLFEDTAALAGLGIAALGIAAARWTHEPLYDGVASIGIGLLLAITAGLLAQETKALLVGEAALPEVEASVRRLAAAHPQVQAVHDVLTTHLAPDQIVVALGIEFRDGLLTEDIEACVADIEARLQEEHPEVRNVFVKPIAGPQAA